MPEVPATDPLSLLEERARVKRRIGRAWDLYFTLVDHWLGWRHRDHGEALTRVLPPLEGDVPAPGSEPVVYCAADPVFLVKFAGLLAMSLAASSRSARLHIHVYGKPDETVSAMRELLEQRLGRHRLTMSFEAWDEARWHGYRRILYFQTVRCARVLQGAARTRLSFLAVDIDVLFLAPAERIAALCRGADLAARLRPEAREQGRRMRAAALYLGPTPQARAVLGRAVARMLLHLLHGPEDRLLDQRRFFAAMRQASGARIVGFPPEILSDDPETALLFTGRSRAKFHRMPAVALQRFPEGIALLAAGLPGAIGRISGLGRCAIAGRDRPGYLTYGPYIDLPSGHYTVTFSYAARGTGHAWDVAHAAGTLASGPGSFADTDGATGSLTVPLRLDRPLSAIEIRTHYGGEGQFTLWQMQLQKVGCDAARVGQQTGRSDA